MASLISFAGAPEAWFRRVAVTAAVTAVAVGISGSYLPNPARAAVDASDEPAKTAFVGATPVRGSHGGLVASDGVSAQINARLSGERVEDVSQRTDSTSTYALADGSWQTAMSLSPVWVRRGGDGTSDDDWAAFDASLVKDGDGGFRPVAHAGDIKVSGAQTAGKDGASVVASMTDPATEAVTRLTFQGDLPAPTVTGERALYADVQRGIDMVVDVTGAGVEQFFIVHEAPSDPAALEFELGLVSKDATVSEPKNALVDLKVDGETAARAATPLMWDATYDKQLANPVTQTWDNDAQPELWAGSPTMLDDPNGATRKEPGTDTSTSRTSEEPIGEPETGVVAEVPAQVVTDDAKDGEAEVTMTPGEDFLANPQVQYPVVVDPSVSLGLPRDTFVQTDWSDDASLQTDLRVGTYNGTDKARSFLNVDVSKIKGKKITSAKLNLWQFHSWSCTAKSWEVWSADLAVTGTVWSNQPKMSNKWATSTDTKGYSSSCADGWSNVTITELVQAWADQTPTTRGLALRATSETDEYGWKRFNSTNASSGKPTITVSYNSYPNTPGTSSIKAGQFNWYTATDSTKTLYVKTKTPTLSSVVSDPDGGTARGVFDVLQGSTLVWDTKTGTTVASGSSSTFTPGSNATPLTEGATYTSRVWAHDGTLKSKSAKSLWTFKIDTLKPATPAVAATGYTNGQWKDTKPTSNTFTFKSTSTDVVRFEYSLDGGAWTSVAATGTTPTATLASNPAAGAHTLKVRAVDKAAWASSETTFTFGAGGASISAPTSAGTKSTSTVPVKAAAPAPSSGTVTANAYWRVGGGAEPSDFSQTNGSRTGWTAVDEALPIFTSNGMLTTSATLDVAAIASELGRDRTATKVDVQVCFNYNSPEAARCSWTGAVASHATATYVPHAFGDNFPTAEAGPGELALWTGELALSSEDVAVAELSIGRSYATNDASTAQAGVFGPGWISDIDSGGIAGMAGYTVTDDTAFDGTISLTDGYGTPLTFAQPGTGRVVRKSGVYVAADDTTASAQLHVEVSGSDTQGRGTVLTATDSLGTVTEWRLVSNLWRVQEVRDSDVPGLTRFDYDTAGRTTRIVAPTPQATDPVTCNAGAEKRGCRVLALTYGTTNAGTDTAPGDRAGQVKEIAYTAWDPDASAMKSTVIARYAYNSAGLLVKVTDPRSNLSTTYTYGGISNAGVPLLTGVTPSGIAGWIFQYGTTAVDSKALVAVARFGANEGDPNVRTNRYVYGINPAATVSGLPLMNTEAIAGWGQDTAPTYGAAVFDLDAAKNVPGSGAANVTAAMWPYADLYYTDDQGRTTNTAQYGAGDWQLTSTTFDEGGRPNRVLAAGAIAQIRDAIAAGTEVDPDEYATITQYNSDITNTAAATGPADEANPDGTTIPAGTVVIPAGTLVTDVWHPAREVTDPSTGEVITARAHVQTSFDQGAPNNGVNPQVGSGFGLATSMRIIQEPVGEAAREVAIVTAETRYGYAPIDAADALAKTSGWTLQTPTTVTTEMGATDIVAKTLFDGLGREIERRQPKSAGADAGTTLTGYYTADAQTGRFAECGSRPEWDGLECQTRTPETTPSTPITTTQYNYYQDVRTTTEVNGIVTRKSAQTFLSDGRPDVTTVAVTGLAGSEPVPATKMLYDAASGMTTGTATIDGAGVETGRVSTKLDRWARPVLYTDSDGKTTTTTYDAAGNKQAVVDEVGTTTYTTDGVAEHRGLVTAVDLDGKGTFAAVYDAAGNVVSQSAPGQINQNRVYDRVGQLVEMSYDTAGDGNDEPASLAAWTIGRDLFGRVVTQDTNLGIGADGSQGRSLVYGYDRALRLTKVSDTLGVCEGGRTYGFDVNGNRTSQAIVASTLDGETGTCSSSATTTISKSWTYDSADRVTNGATIGGASSAAYQYDALGRQTSIPGVDTPAGSLASTLSIGYYATDAVRALKQGAETTTFTLDPSGRRSTESVVGAAGSTRLQRHYTDSSDNPGWVENFDAAGQAVETWYGSSAAGDVSFAVTNDALRTLTLADPHGDTALTLPIGGSVFAASSFDEYGNELVSGEANISDSPDYGWLGSHERATLGSGIMLMGARLYNSTTGLFTSVDPIVGGNTTAYAYPQDPVNFADITGLWSWALEQTLKGVRWGIDKAAILCGRLPNPALGVACSILAGGFVGVLGKVIASKGKATGKQLAIAFAGGAALGLWNTYGRFIARIVYHTKVGGKLIGLMRKNSHTRKALYAAEDWMTDRRFL